MVTQTPGRLATGLMWSGAQQPGHALRWGLPEFPCLTLLLSTSLRVPSAA